MRIGIMTLWNTEHNYGAVLQCYALQEYLRRNGHDPFLIKYRDAPRKFFNYRLLKPTHVIQAIMKRLKRVNKVKSRCVEKGEERHFECFKEKYIHSSDREYIGYDELKINFPEADAYIVGSDQVWNFYDQPLFICKDRIHAFLLDFGKSETKRLSYAASCDPKYVTDEQIGEIAGLMEKFSYVSVREDNGLKVCYKCGRKDAVRDVDPTLLLDADDYRKLYNDPGNRIRKISENYILVYRVLTREQDLNMVAVYKFARRNRLRVIYVTEDHTADTYEKYYPTIPEWLYLMDNARYVVTNSYHGTVFSLLFHKQFATIPLTGYESGTNSRVESLCNDFGLAPRWLIDYDFSILREAYVTKRAENERNFNSVLTNLYGGGGINWL